MKIIRNKLDALWSKYIRLRDRNTCQRCGGQGTQCAHVFSRGSMGVRYDEMNCVTLCGGCHMWGHAHPLDFYAWYQFKYGMRAYERIRIMSKIPHKVHSLELQGLLVWLKQKLKEYDQDFHNG